MLKARVTFRVMKLGSYVIVDDGGNYVTERSHKDKKKIITPHNESLGRLWFALLSRAIKHSDFILKFFPYSVVNLLTIFTEL